MEKIKIGSLIRDESIGFGKVTKIKNDGFFAFFEDYNEELFYPYEDLIEK